MPAKPPFFINLPVRHIEMHPEYLEYFVEHGLSPEIGLDPIVLDRIPRSRHEEIAGIFARAGLPCAVHLPFFDLQPGSLDDGIVEATRARLRKAYAIATVYEPRHMVGHVMYTGLYVEFYTEWLERSLETWRELDRVWPDHPPLYLENTYERTPDPVVAVVAGLASPVSGNPGESGISGESGKAGKFGVCFDAGHWHSFSGGSAKGDLAAWLDALAPWIGHLHLHDNDGSGDQHLGLGRGSIPYEQLLASLKARGVTPTFTLEPHTREDLFHSLAWIGERKELFAGLADGKDAGKTIE